jgi:spore maturation protein CgeB
MKKIILVAGNLDPAKSYEFHNFIKPLEKMGNEVLPFDFMKILLSCGREQMNLKLLSFVKEHLPHLVIFVPQTDEFIPQTIDEIGRYSLTLGYFYDDMWRIDYSRFWAQHYNFVTTSDINGINKFKEAGHTNVIYSPFACNNEIYCNKNMPKLYDVTFVGGYNPYREWYINYLKKEGINVQTWGIGWESKMLSSEDMINVFNQSRINLNLSNNVCWDIRYLLNSDRSFRKTLHIWKQTFLATRQSDFKTVEQVKGRHFEINACGGFQLSYYVEGLEKLYRIGEEISLFFSPDDLLQKVKYFLKHDDERELIAISGLERTHKEHTMEKRFHHILEQMARLEINK